MFEHGLQNADLPLLLLNLVLDNSVEQLVVERAGKMETQLGEAVRGRVIFLRERERGGRERGRVKGREGRERGRERGREGRERGRGREGRGGGGRRNGRERGRGRVEEGGKGEGEGWRWKEGEREGEERGT